MLNHTNLPAVAFACKAEKLALIFLSFVFYPCCKMASHQKFNKFLCPGNLLLENFGRPLPFDTQPVLNIFLNFVLLLVNKFQLTRWIPGHANNTPVFSFIGTQTICCKNDSGDHFDETITNHFDVTLTLT